MFPTGSTEAEGRSLMVRRRLLDAAFALALLLAVVPFGGCARDARVVSLSAGAGGTFAFGARTNTVMTENDDGAAELIRRSWLADALIASGTCRVGYVLDSRRFVQAQGGIFGNGGEIVYTGRCL
jgi:hypothetical protein